MRLAMLLLLAAAMPAFAADPAPEIQRPPAAPQAVGTVHTIRGIPEACTRLEGMFTGDAGKPYAFEAVRTAPNCQARAHFIDASEAKPQKSGWILNDVIRIPSSACPSQQAVVRVWRRPGDAAPPKLDAQGRSRIYLQESIAKAKAHALPSVPAYTATMAVEGSACP